MEEDDRLTAIEGMSLPLHPNPTDPHPEWLADFREAERRGFRLQLKVRAFILFLIALTFLPASWERLLTVAAYCLSLILLGVVVDWLVVRMSNRWWRWLAGALITFDVATLCVIVAVPSLVMDLPWPPQVALRFSTFLYVVLYVMGSALTTSPTLVLWTGGSAAAAWSACVLWVVSLPDTVTVGNVHIIEMDIPVADPLRLFLDPFFVSMIAFQAQILVLVLGASVLAFGVWRSRRFMMERARFETERRTLARYVPVDLADDLASASPAPAVQRKSVAVLFVDLVGFTTFAERVPPETALTVLSEFRSWVAAVVLEHGGTVDKFIGDAVMVTFGARGGQAEPYAGRALRCLVDIVDAMVRWNVAREATGEAPLQAGIGLHCGPVLVGTIGATERLEHTVVGDVVNVASRLERLTREVGAPALVSEAVFEQACHEREEANLPDRFGPPMQLSIRGRTGAIKGRSLKANSHGTV